MYVVNFLLSTTNTHDFYITLSNVLISVQQKIWTLCAILIQVLIWDCFKTAIQLYLQFRLQPVFTYFLSVRKRPPAVPEPSQAAVP